MLGLAFVLGILGLLLAVVFYFQWQSSSRAVIALRKEADDARKDTEAARAEQRKAQEELKAARGLLTESREKLAEARKRAQEGKGAKAQSRGAREAELEEDLLHARKLLEEAHASEQAARKDLLEARAGEQQAKSELQTAQGRIRDLASRPAPEPLAAAAPPAELEKQLEAAKSELERQVAQADRHAREAKRREHELREEMKKHKGRAETNNRVFLVTKGELELTKERLAQAERKLWQAGIPLSPPAQKDRPKATGPAAAERPRDEAATSAAEAGEPISEGESEGTQTPAESTPVAGLPGLPTK